MALAFENKSHLLKHHYHSLLYIEIAPFHQNKIVIAF